MPPQKKSSRKAPPKKSQKKTAPRTKRGKIFTRGNRTPKKRAKSKRSFIRENLIRTFAGIFILLVLVIAAAVVFHQVFPGRSNDKTNGSAISRSVRPPLPKEKLNSGNSVGRVSRKKTPDDSGEKRSGSSLPEKPEVSQTEHFPTFEIFPENDFAYLKNTPGKASSLPRNKRPRVAIIIDDLGYDMDLAEKFVRADSGFSFSVIPFSPHYKRVAKMVRKNGGELLLHLPMEPLEYPRIKPGPGALLTGMTPDELLTQLKKNLEAVPGIRGVNGHMGSRLTASSARMNQVFTILKRQNLFFVDSYTTPESACMSSARLLKVPFARRDVFIDHVQDAEVIRGQIDLLVDLAQKNGEAVGIVHPYSVTLEVLNDLLPELKKQVDLTPVSNLTKIIG